VYAGTGPLDFGRRLVDALGTVTADDSTVDLIIPAIVGARLHHEFTLHDPTVHDTRIDVSAGLVVVLGFLPHFGGQDNEGGWG
jgi:hypothetical protein